MEREEVGGGRGMERRGRLSMEEVQVSVRMGSTVLLLGAMCFKPSGLPQESRLMGADSHMVTESYPWLRCNPRAPQFTVCLDLVHGLNE